MPKTVEKEPEKYETKVSPVKEESKDTIAKIKKIMETAKEEGKGKCGDKIPANLKLPLRNGDMDRPEDEAYGCCYRSGGDYSRESHIRIGTIMTITSKLAGVINAAKSVFAVFNAVCAAKPYVLISVALVADFIYLWNNCEEFRQFLIDLWESIKEIVVQYGKHRRGSSKQRGK